MATKKPIQGEINPFEQEHWYKPLWCVYGYKAYPQLLLCKINAHNGPPAIWGYSRGKFMTIGNHLEAWLSSHIALYRKDLPHFFDVQDNALAYLKKITTPKNR